MQRRLLIALATLLIPATALAQTLGQVHFPNSGNDAAQEPFLRGVALLHSFEYEEAAAEFRRAQAADPDFALAVWGEAMTYTHPLWNQQDSMAARATLRKLGDTREERLSRAGSPRERDYLEVTEALYFANQGKPARDTLASAAWERLSAAYPDDFEARAFDALWLMGLSQGVRNVPTYMRAGAIAEALYRENPKHPGALHYIIHAFDDPTHAPLGLYAAREYSAIAADAAHAQHMTTHIFLALGMWPETVRQNAIASGPDTSAWRPGHYTAWLGYGLLQQGRFDAARAHLASLHDHLSGGSSRGQRSYLMGMRADYLVNTERWDDEVAGWAVDTAGASRAFLAADLFGRSLARLRQGNRAAATSGLAGLESLVPKNGYSAEEGLVPRVPQILARQLRALLEYEGGQHDAAADALRQLAAEEDALPVEFGPPLIVKPTHELLGELLLAMQRPATAQQEFTLALEHAPGRLRSLVGLARAASAAGDSTAARRATDALRKLAPVADPGVVALRSF